MSRITSLNNDSKIPSLLEIMAVPLRASKKTKALEEIKDRIGGLSKPSKMPGYSWGISPSECITGSKLAKVEGTPCSICYAKKGFYAFTPAKAAHEVRLEGWKSDPDWVYLMSIALLLHRNEPSGDYFRWFDAGDLQSSKMFEDIVAVATWTPDISHWVPTQERAFVNWDIVPENLTVRISASKLNTNHVSTTLASSVGGSNVQGVHICPSRQQNNQCGSCRACWDQKVKHVRYLAH